MHAYRRLIQAEMDKRGWKPADLVRHSGLTKQTVSNLLSDDRDELRQRPGEPTVLGLQRAFGIARQVILSAIAEAMDLPVGERVVVYDASHVSDEELLRVLADRLREREEGEGDADRPAATRQAEVSSAEEPATATPPPLEVVATPVDAEPLFDRHPSGHQWSAEVQRDLDEQAKAARRGAPANPPDTTSDEGSQVDPREDS